MSTDVRVVDPNAYTSDNIVTLKDAAHIRQNPGMYVGDTLNTGLHHLVFEIVYNSVDEALVGHCSQIKIVIHKDGSLSVVDDGRGIPVETKEESGRSTLEEVLTIVGTSGKFDNAAYKVSAGLHGMGAKAVNALSEWMKAEVRRDGRVYTMAFKKGYVDGELQDIGPAPKGVTGTTITFKPDPTVMQATEFSFDILADRIRELAFLNKGLQITLTDEIEAKSEVFKYEGGIAEFVAYLNGLDAPIHPPIYMQRETDGMTAEIALQYTKEGETEQIRCYANNAYNAVGGTHLSGFRTGLTRAMGAYGRKEGHFKDRKDNKEIEILGQDYREGMTAIVSVGHPDPHFESQTKVRLNNPEVDGFVASVVYEALTEYLEKHPKEGKEICKKILLAAEARLAAKKAREAITNRKGLLSGGGLPGKLMDCTTRERDKSELFLVEGDSAGGCRGWTRPDGASRAAVAWQGLER